MDEKNISKNIITFSYTYSFINAALMIYSQFFIKSNNNQSRLLKFRIFLLIAIDSFMIAFKLIYQNFLDIIEYEVINTFLISFQFYEFTSFITELFTNIFKIKENELLSPFIMSFICYLIYFPYYKFLYSYNRIIFVILLAVRYFCIWYLYYYFNNNTNNNEKDDNINPFKLYINNKISTMIKICLITLMLYNFFELGIIFYNSFNYNLILYSSSIGIKYIIFLISISINYSLSKSNFNLHEYEISNENNIDINNK